MTTSDLAESIYQYVMEALPRSAWETDEAGDSTGDLTPEAAKMVIAALDKVKMGF